jgi:UDP-GlcNAc:undecaprenyl-phosphate/decaprenyl-phosphate GlcNAc-1-phosphate transferase
MNFIGEDKMRYFLAFSFVFIMVYILIPGLRKLAVKINFVDRPTERKRHKEPVPHLGGVGIFAGFILGYIIFIKNYDRKSLAVLIGAALIIIIGLVDDWYKTHGKEFPPMPRLIVQVGAAVLAYCNGIDFTGFNNPFTDQYVILPSWMQFILSILWIFGVTTVINFIDGMDGLAGGISTISALTLFVVALVKGQYDSAMMAVILIGSCVGFLKYNKYPAQIYMGDSGATFLGFILGIIALDGAFKQATVVSIFIPILALGVPIFDNIFVVIKRFKEGKPIYKADASQVHYRLLSNGLNQIQVVNILYLISIGFALIAILLLILKL